MNARIKEIREYSGLNQRDFAKKINVGASTLAMFETGDRKLKDIHINRICSEFGINEIWLRNGCGSMFKEPLEDETAKYVSDLLETEDNDLFTIIKEIMHTYHELSPSSQTAVKEFSTLFLENIKNRVGGR